MKALEGFSRTCLVKMNLRALLVILALQGATASKGVLMNVSRCSVHQCVKVSTEESSAAPAN